MTTPPAPPPPPPEAVIAAVWADEAAVDPPAFVAVTTDRIVWPTSPAANVYELEVAPLITVQEAPELLQSSH
jgi:hypothetical protein